MKSSLPRDVTMPSEETEDRTIDISKNLTIEQMLTRAYRMLPSKTRAGYDAISRRTGIPLIKLLEEGVELGMAKVKRKLNRRRLTP